ncbi:MAG: hypothetical protein B7Y99_10580 [Caulobacterales bacterium 32-69-10]|nr:MAG: hypothetical protein B7Y99_10580 [Caulobacterales bacterium 32-69-10]
MLSIFAAAVAAASPAAAQPTAPAAVDAIEITARRPVVGDLKEGVQAYRSEFFTAVRPGTAFDMVQWLPGFTMEETRDMRGLGGSVGNVLIDGQPPTSKNDTLQTVLRRIPASQVERVDIIVGGAPGIDMRGRSVIANVVLKKTGAPKGQIQAQSNLLTDGRMSPELQFTTNRRFGERTVEGALTLARRQIINDGAGSGPLVRTDGDGAVAFIADSGIHGAQRAANGSGAYQFPWAGGKLRLNASAIYSRVAVTERADQRGAAAVYSIDFVDTFRQGELGARYERKFGRTTWESQALQRLNGHSQQVATNRPPIVSDLDESDTLSESVARTTVRFAKSPKLTLEASAEGAYNRQTTSSLFRNQGVLTPIPASDLTVSERRGEVGALVTWKPSGKFSMTGATKVETSALTAAGDFSVDRDLTYVKPRLVLAWTPHPKTQIRLRGEHEVNQIGFGNFVSVVEASTGLPRAGNPDLRPRRAWVGEIVLERQFWTGASMVFTLRQSALRDVVDQRPLAAFGGATAVGNIGDGRQTEAIATVTLPLKRLGLDGVNLKGTGSWRWSEVTDPTTGERRRLSGQSPFVGDAHFSHDLPRLKLTWGVDAVYQGASKGYRPTLIQTVGSVLRISAFVEYRLRPDLNLRVEGFNLTDARQSWSVANYAGLRDRSPLVFTDARRPGDGPYLFVRVRKTLN